MRPLERKLLKALGCGLLLFVVASIFLAPVFTTAYPVSKSKMCLSNLKQQALGLVMYAGDNDDRFARRDSWMDDVRPYVKQEGLFHDPEVPKGIYGYAFDGALSGAKAPAGASTTPMVYDSVNPIRNASDLVTSLPSPGRHMGLNGIGYADGHAKALVVQ